MKVEILSQLAGIIAKNAKRDCFKLRLSSVPVTHNFNIVKNGQFVTLIQSSMANLVVTPEQSFSRNHLLLLFLFLHSFDLGLGYLLHCRKLPASVIVTCSIHPGLRNGLALVIQSPFLLLLFLFARQARNRHVLLRDCHRVRVLGPVEEVILRVA